MEIPQKPGGKNAFFLVNGDTKENYMFEFLEPLSSTATASLSLRTIVRQFACGSSPIRTVLASKMYLILGRLRYIATLIAKYNQTLVLSDEGSFSFVSLWQPRTLNYLSGFGFQLKQKEPIQIHGLKELIETIEYIYQEEIELARQFISNGQITFDALQEAYQIFQPVFSSSGERKSFFQVTEVFYEERRSLVGMEKSFHLGLEYVVALGKNHFSIVHFTEVLSGWTGVRTRPLDSLNYIPICSQNERDEIDIFVQRGHRYIEYACQGQAFLAYQPNTFYVHALATTASHSLARSNSSLLPKSGRLMVDTARGAILGHYASQGYDEPTQGMIQLAGKYRRWIQNPQTKAHEAGIEFLWEKDQIPKEMVLFCWPALVGFSFTAKAWGHVLVAGLEPIQFRDQAFEQLVLAPERKQLIQALVRFGSDHESNGLMEDIIEGKQGGSIFLLHGPPGVGKTLTAEAIAEVLHRPLYYVTMGEMGLTPEEMEKRLSDVLELCAEWNALTLLDEADVFLEQRTPASNDITRNAMVCVMLRLLEYHPGILFLTTNRVRKFDPAFESRVTIALKYEPLTVDARRQVWLNLLSKVNVPILMDTADYDQIASKYVLNGRQIKNAIRLGVALALERKTPLTQEILEITLQITSIGRQEMKQDLSWQE
jgi:hypothetical protein